MCALDAMQNSRLKFIWHGHIPRVFRKTIFKNEQDGGLKAPNLMKCYLSAQITYILMLQLTNDTPWQVLLEVPKPHPTSMATLQSIPNSHSPIDSWTYLEYME